MCPSYFQICHSYIYTYCMYIYEKKVEKKNPQKLQKGYILSGVNMVSLFFSLKVRNTMHVYNTSN